jgi:hypothetical protein
MTTYCFPLLNKWSNIFEEAQEQSCIMYSQSYLKHKKTNSYCI